MTSTITKNEAYRMLEREAPEAIIGAIECNGGVVIPIVDIYDHPEALDLIHAQSVKAGRYHSVNS